MAVRLRVPAAMSRRYAKRAVLQLGHIARCSDAGIMDRATRVHHDLTGGRRRTRTVERRRWIGREFSLLRLRTVNVMRYDQQCVFRNDNGIVVSRFRWLRSVFVGARKSGVAKIEPVSIGIEGETYDCYPHLRVGVIGGSVGSVNGHRQDSRVGISAAATRSGLIASPAIAASAAAVHENKIRRLNGHNRPANEFPAGWNCRYSGYDRSD